MCKPLNTCTPKKDGPQAKVSTEIIAEALQACRGNVAAATRWIKKNKNIQITQQAVSLRVHNDEELLKVRNSAIEVFVDDAEDVLMEEVKNKNLTAEIFALKTLGRKRGYSQAFESVISNANGMPFKVEEKVNLSVEQWNDLAEQVLGDGPVNSESTSA